MAEVTRVPLQPIAPGSLTRLWLGVLAAVVLAAGAAWLMVPEGVSVDTIEAGSGESPAETDVVFVRYVGRLPDGTVFDQSEDIPLPVPGVLPEGTPMPLEGVVPGFREGLLKMQRGGKYEIFIPSEKAYGDEERPGSPIPPGSDLTFEVELVDFMPRAEFDQRVQAIRQLMAQMPPPGAEPPVE